MIIYTKHSETRLLQRNIEKKKIQKTILNPDKKITSFRKRWLARKKFADLELEVVFIPEDNDFIIITAYWLYKENK